MNTQWTALVTETWKEDILRRTFEFNHFFFCYIHPRDIKLLTVLVRFEAHITGNRVSFYCPLLDRIYTEEDFRPHVRTEILTNVGLKYDERRECYKLCPHSLRSVDFLTNQKNEMQNDLTTAWWLPQPIHYEWVREV